MAAKPQPRKAKKTGPGRAVRARSRVTEAEPAGRYTPPVPTNFRFRPGWHKAVGAASIVVGLGLFFICQFNVFGIHDYGGHVWYLIGFAIAGSSIWWFGAFDPSP